jgi:hypothetical protein
MYCGPARMRSLLNGVLMLSKVASQLTDIPDSVWCAKYIYVLSRAAKNLEYLSQSGCPLLENGPITTFPLPLSGSQLNTFTRQRVCNRPLTTEMRTLTAELPR